jgi:hypothetical protein
MSVTGPAQQVALRQLGNCHVLHETVIGLDLAKAVVGVGDVLYTVGAVWTAFPPSGCCLWKEDGGYDEVRRRVDRGRG